ncbi:hypothetical protein [uncultured Marinobacter sp.]|uniref:hypothetical protein n=1 Tax=uncultured Marinobacter sp. TaxID=187379 RepID=UPI0030D8DB48
MTVLVLDNPELIARVAAMEAEQAARQQAEKIQMERVRTDMEAVENRHTELRQSVDSGSRNRQDAFALVS